MSAYDDEQIGRVLSRRDALNVLGAAGLAMIAACTNAREPAGDAPRASSPTGQSPSSSVSPSVSPASCIVRPEQSEGPYFVDAKLNRSDIRGEADGGGVRTGTPLSLAVAVTRADAARCVPLQDALVDVWHCDAEGRYSGVDGEEGKVFLRGHQITGTDGLARFTTIYPGWYRGRAPHIHFKIRTEPQGRGLDFTSQMYFDEAVNDAVYRSAAYRTRTGGRRVRNADDGLYANGGRRLTIVPAREGDGYAARFDITLATS